MRKVIAVLGGFLVGCASAPVVVQEADTYNSWPMVQAMGSRLVLAVGVVRDENNLTTRPALKPSASIKVKNGVIDEEKLAAARF